MDAIDTSGKPTGNKPRVDDARLELPEDDRQPQPQPSRANVPQPRLSGSADRVTSPPVTVTLPDINRSVTVTPVPLGVDLGNTPAQKAAQLDAIRQRKEVDTLAEQGGQIEEFNSLFAEEAAAAHREGRIEQPTAQNIRDVSVVLGYFDSPRHRAFCELASARTGGVVPPEWFRDAEPLGGIPGGMPHDWKANPALPDPVRDTLGTSGFDGSPEGIEQRKAMWLDHQDPEMLLGNTGIAHDVDVALGRYFNAGPLKPLYGEHFHNVGAGVVPGDPKDPRVRQKFADEGLPIPDYTFSNGNTSGWSFSYLDEPGLNRPEVRLLGHGARALLDETMQMIGEGMSEARRAGPLLIP